MSSSNSNRLTSDKRKRLSQACNSCHQKKTKCDGQKPTCGSCSRNSSNCVYPSKAIKRGPRQGFTERLESRLEAIEKKVESLFDLFSNRKDLTNQNSPPAPSDPSLHLSSDTFNIFEGRLSKPVKGLGDLPFLTPELSLSLLKLYFENIHPILPIIHPSSFFQRYKRNDIPQHLLYSIYSVASKFSDCPELQRTPRWKQGDVFEAQASAQIVGVSDFSLDYLASLILLAKSLYQRGQISRGWLYGGISVRAAHVLALHTADEKNAHVKSPAPEKWILAERQRRTWWGCYTIDSYASAATGRPPTINEFPSQVSLPKVTDGWEDDPTHEIPPGISPTRGQTWFTQYIKLIAILSSVAKFVYPPLSSQPSPALLSRSVVSHHSQLTSWLLQLPDNLKMENARLDSSAVGEISNRHVWCLHALYHATIIVLYSSKPARKSELGDISQVCLNSADNITHIFSSCFEAFPQLFSPFYVNYCAFLANRVYLDSPLHLSWDALITSNTKFATNYQLIQNNRTYWSMAEHYCRILKDIYYSKSTQPPAETIPTTAGETSASQTFQFNGTTDMSLFNNVNSLTQYPMMFQQQFINSLQIPRPLEDSSNSWASQSFPVFPVSDKTAPNFNFDHSFPSNQLAYTLMAQNFGLRRIVQPNSDATASNPNCNYEFM
ncbi:hypothetical protein DSO57_1010336 [Entomophthora muscae]|uniref:Uncharacterized protein n=1 Tax=Entomophthora muscae TaxID=34485 RepID=A0ACC2TH68_9FUNG|nr:hypothetical protein DSO57_1010336 [Entomophthora muscae]